MVGVGGIGMLVVEQLVRCGFGTFVLIPNFVEMPHGLGATASRVIHYGFDASATKAGLYLLPSSLTLLFAGPLAGLIGKRVGFKWPLAAGMLLIAASAGSLGRLEDLSEWAAGEPKHNRDADSELTHDFDLRPAARKLADR